MSKTFIGVIELDPRQLLEDGIRKELGREIENTLNNCIIFSAVQADEISDSGETTFVRFASILDSSLQGFISFPDLILQFENTCREVSELLREEATGGHRVIEDKFMRQKAQMLLDEAATWSLVWYLFGKCTEDNLGDIFVSPSTLQQVACDFVMTDHTAQLCLRIVQWLEDLASKAVNFDKKVKGWYTGSYLHK